MPFPSDGDLAALVEKAGLREPSIVLQSLADGRRAALQPERALYPASMIKPPLAAAALLLIGRGELAYGQQITVDAANMTPNDKPSPLVPGYHTTLDELLLLMIARSDNVATNQLFDLLGRARATGLVQDELGLRSTSFHRKLSGADPLIADPGQTGRNAHSAADAARLFALIAANGFQQAARLRLDLGRQEWNAKLSRGLLAGDRFEHKTGDTDEVSHDGGILTTATGERFVLVVYTGSGSSDSVDDRFAAFMHALRPSLGAH